MDVGAVVLEAMDGDTSMDTMVAEAAMDRDITMDTMDAEADTVDTTTYPCHIWAEPRWSCRRAIDVGKRYQLAYAR